jgi:hypothetical protein
VQIILLLWYLVLRSVYRFQKKAEARIRNEPQSALRHLSALSIYSTAHRFDDEMFEAVVVLDLCCVGTGEWCGL